VTNDSLERQALIKAINKKNMNKAILKVTYNFHQYGNNENGIDAHYCDEEVGKGGVLEINEHTPKNGLERHYCVINYENGKALKVFNIDTIEYASE